MPLNIEELRKQGLNNLADLIEAKGEDKEEDEDEAGEAKDKDMDMKSMAGKKGVNPFDAKESMDDDEEDDDEDKEDDDKAMKVAGDVKESVAAMFSGVEGLTEEFKAKAEVTFIAAVKEAATKLAESKYAKLEKRIAKQLDEQAKEQEASIDSYLTYVSEQWLEENKEAVESKVQTKLTESFISGLKDLFESHNIEVPAGKQDLVESLQEELKATQTALKSAIVTIQEVEEKAIVDKKVSIVDEACVGLTDTQVDKFHGLAKEFMNEDVKSFETKVQAIKEYFSTVPVAKSVDESVAKVDVPENKSIDESEGTSKPKVDEKMTSYLAAIRRSR